MRKIAITLAVFVAWSVAFNASAAPPADGVLRTPEERFTNLPGYPFAPNYVEIDGLRIHYVDEGPRDAPPVLMFHGEPSWSYLYRKMIPVIVAAGYRAVAPDLVGFGRSDKWARIEDHSYQRHVDLMTGFVRELDLQDTTLFVQDWGGLIGLRVLANEQDRFARAVVANTGLPAAGGVMGWLGYPLFKARVWWEGEVSQVELAEDITFPRWVAYSRTVPVFPVGGLLQQATVTELSPAEVAAYDAPFPDESYKAGPRAMPYLVPSQLRENARVWETVLENWQKPLLTAFSDGDPITRGGEKPFQERVPGAQGQPHGTVLGAGHFLQEDKGEDLAHIVVEFIRATQ